MGDINKLPIQHRTCQIRAEDIDADGRKVKLSFSSETPVERFYGNEILSHEKGHVRLERINTKAPLLYNHDPADQIGVVESATVKDGRGEAIVRLSRSARGEEMLKDIQDGIRSSVSVGYRIYDMAEEKRGKGEPSDFRVTEWEPLEISIVSIPADTSVGVGRNHEPAFAVRVQYAENQEPAGPAGGEGTGDNQPKTQSRIMEQPSAPAKAPEINVGEIRQKEKERIREISAIGRQFKLEAEAEKAIAEEKTVDDFRKLALESIGKGEGWSGDAPDPKAAARFNDPIGMSKKDVQRFSLVKAMRELSQGKPLSGLEGEVSGEVAKRFPELSADNGINLPADIVIGKRDLEAGLGSEGGYTVQEDVGGLIELLYNKSVVLQRCTQLTGLRNNIALPKLASGATAYWVDEEGSVTESAATFGQVLMQPKRLSVRSVISDQLLRQSSLSVENVVRNDMMRQGSLKLERSVLHGLGSGNEPLGIDKASGLNTLTFGGAATWADYVDAWEKVATDNADMGQMVFVLTPASVEKGLTIEKASNTAQFLINGLPGTGFTALGFPVLVTNQITGNVMFFGNFADCVVGTWGAMTVVVDPYSKAQTGQIAYTISSFHDVAVRHGQSFTVSTDSAAQ